MSRFPSSSFFPFALTILILSLQETTSRVKPSIRDGSGTSELLFTRLGLVHSCENSPILCLEQRLILTLPLQQLRRRVRVDGDERISSLRRRREWPTSIFDPASWYWRGRLHDHAGEEFGEWSTSIFHLHELASRDAEDYFFSRTSSLPRPTLPCLKTSTDTSGLPTSFSSTPDQSILQLPITSRK